METWLTRLGAVRHLKACAADDVGHYANGLGFMSRARSGLRRLGNTLAWGLALAALACADAQAAPLPFDLSRSILSLPAVEVGGTSYALDLHLEADGRLRVVAAALAVNAAFPLHFDPSVPGLTVPEVGLGPSVFAVALRLDGDGLLSVRGVAPVPPDPVVLGSNYRASGHAAQGDVFVHLFEWKWTEVASECETVLGPKGYKGVQVAPPQEHYDFSAWWSRYQPVSYKLDQSRSGTRAEFIDMVGRCARAGVDVYADAVINHMTAGAGVGTAGTVYTKYNYPGLYTPADFHPPCTVTNYQDMANVQNCELLGLADLDTSKDNVRQRIADYLLDLAHIGVKGYRIDAAKHINPLDLNAILRKVNAVLSAEGRSLPYVFGEVVDYGGEAVKGSQYFGVGFDTGGVFDITEFKARGVGDKFIQKGGTQQLADLNPNGAAGHQFSVAAWGLLPADKAVMFLENHDTQRVLGNRDISYRDGNVYRLAAVWMLAQPYGYPSVMSSYAFDRDSQAGVDAGRPTAGQGCAARMESAVIGQWVCEHRDAWIANMVAFRRYVAGTAQANWWDDGANAIAFSRGNKGFVAINRETSAVTRSFATGLAPGTYCDVLTGGKAGSACAGTSWVVAADGTLSLSLAPNSAVVLQADNSL
jgi:alpha-amylase